MVTAAIYLNIYRKEAPEPRWQLGIDLRENERYIFGVRQMTQTNSMIDIDDQDVTNSSETDGSFIEYQIEELCGDDKTYIYLSHMVLCVFSYGLMRVLSCVCVFFFSRSWLSFLVKDYRGSRNTGLDNLYPRKYSSYLSDNATVEQTHFSGVLRDLLKDHSWNAKLSHDARKVLRTDNRNIEMMLDCALEKWSHKNYDEL